MIQTISTIVFSIVIILFGHYLWNSIKDTYSTKKTKDLVGSQTQKYKNILNEYIENTKPLVPINTTTSYLSEEEKTNMNMDLLQFIQNQSNQSATSALVSNVPVVI